MPVVSIDLAYKNYRDIGVAVLAHANESVTARFIRVPLTGEPKVDVLAEYLATLASVERADLMLIDGPQAWKGPNNGLEHSRVCERALNTPAKTGLPGRVKPANYQPFVAFSIQLFDELTRLGWARLMARERPRSSTAMESFPLSAWRTLGLSPLPAKAKTSPATLAEKFTALRASYPIAVSSQPNHDELQALVSGLAGLGLEDGKPCDVSFAGEAPFLLDGSYREGFIVNPCNTRGVGR
ncbi:MAG: DUF429 domain-containing protein [Gammaproteobacteria bacterium]|nr:DUF429 domain-containing protein [Gammaproteobacteria bacterium]